MILGLNREEVKERILNSIKQYLIDFHHIEKDGVLDEDVNVINDAGLDSIDVVELWMTLEKELDTSLPDPDVLIKDGIMTIGNITEHVTDHYLSKNFHI